MKHVSLASLSPLETFHEATVHLYAKACAFYLKHEKTILTFLILALVCGLVFAAGGGVKEITAADATPDKVKTDPGSMFNSLFLLVKAWVDGGYGQLVIIGTLAVGMIFIMMKQSIMPVMVAVGAAIVIGYGPSLLLNLRAAGF